MRYGRLEVTVGPMFSGKTEYTIKEILWRTWGVVDPDVAVVLKPAYDDRYADEEIVSHAGASVRARSISSWPDDIEGRFSAVFIDEIQFFTEPFFHGDIVDAVRRLRARGADVYCAGLDMDYLGRAFEVPARLMAESTKINRLTARCEMCRAPATMTARRATPATGDGRYDLGAGDVYFPACLEHWAEHAVHTGPAIGEGGAPGRAET